jgi:hypothetical protein
MLQTHVPREIVIKKEYLFLFSVWAFAAVLFQLFSSMEVRRFCIHTVSYALLHIEPN